MDGSVFISYRRADTPEQAEHLAFRLKSWLGRDRVFFDTSDIAPGQDWPARLRRQLRRSTVVVVVIGEEWFGVDKITGDRRIDHPTDWVRREVAEALKKGLRVVPVLVENAPMPQAEDLPRGLTQLPDRQSRPLRKASLDSDCRALIAELEPILGETRPPAAHTVAVKVTVGLLAAVVVVLLVVVVGLAAVPIREPTDPCVSEGRSPQPALTERVLERLGADAWALGTLYNEDRSEHTRIAHIRLAPPGRLSVADDLGNAMVLSPVGRRKDGTIFMQGSWRGVAGDGCVTLVQQFDGRAAGAAEVRGSEFEVFLRPER